MCYRTVVELRGDLVVLRPLADEDVDRIVELGSHPEVARWWPGLTHAQVAEKARGADEGAVVFAILEDGEVAGVSNTSRRPIRTTGTPRSTSSLARRTMAADSVRTPSGRCCGISSTTAVITA